MAEQVFPGATLEHLGTGGFASTFKVTGIDDAPFALKVVDSAQSDAERSDRELAALQRVSHANVVAYRGTGTVEHDGAAYRWLSMEFVEGAPLRSQLRDGRKWTHLEAVQLLQQLVAGAAAIWGEQTSHRDLSPNNVLIDTTGRPVIVDLGLARHLDDITITALPTPGTPGWMSPEQVGDSPTHGDWRSDQFVLGIIGYTLVVGAGPFSYNGRFEAWRAPAVQTPRAPRQLDPTVPTALSDLLMKMLARHPHRRYLQAATLLAELDRVVTALTVTEETVAPGTVPRFYLALADNVGYAMVPGVLQRVAPDGLIIEPRSPERVTTLMNLDRPASTTRLVDPMTHLARSPFAARMVFVQELPYGGADDPLTGFGAPDKRGIFCQQVLDHQLVAGVDAVMAPYFYAASGEGAWIRESLQCAITTREQLEARAPGRGGLLEPVWTTAAVAGIWLAQEDRRDELMTLLTSQPMDTLQLLVHTTQPSFATLGDLATLRGLADLLSIMREAGVPVVLSRRGPEGLLGLALGAAGWGTGPRAGQQNMTPHPEGKIDSRSGPDRVYVPQLLSRITTDTYQLLTAADPGRMALSGPYATELLARSHGLAQIGSEERYLLLQHNAQAARQQVTELAAQAVPARASHLRTVVETAQGHFAALPAMAGPGESSTFVDAWLEVL
ncbi:serine/threonine-protein kinase [uncultured Pseudokineococcus sp.]|uniref:serine/threonine-protein kinase n=1 Tax=uncultured Pseudokineococcus sp. TaxID=1642928 RepID=UPI00261A8F81|nr:serine/threonine-protein kinase [uncultured Pseudokineococcus sp.]